MLLHGQRKCSKADFAQGYHDLRESVTRSGVPRNFFRGWGGSTNLAEDRRQRERGSGGSSPLVRGSGGSFNLVQEISFHIVKFSQFLVLQTIYDDNQFICHC